MSPSESATWALSAPSTPARPTMASWEKFGALPEVASDAPTAAPPASRPETPLMMGRRSLRTSRLCHSRSTPLSSERPADAVVDAVVSPVDAVGVDPEQDGNAVAQAPGDLGRRYASVKPERRSCVT
jgi:hypothetical protein